MKTKTEEKKRLRAFGGELVVLVAVIELLMIVLENARALLS
jgi:hypothetical protein